MNEGMGCHRPAARIFCMVTGGEADGDLCFPETGAGLPHSRPRVWAQRRIAEARGLSTQFNVTENGEDIARSLSLVVALRSWP